MTASNYVFILHFREILKDTFMEADEGIGHFTMCAK